MTLNEVWYGKKPSVSHLKVFGFDALIHVSKENRSKLDKKEVKCIFIGYKEGMKGYKLWDPTSRKKMYSRDVVFREVGRKFDFEVMVKIENDSEKVWFELRNEEEDYSDESTESDKEVEKMTLVVRRFERVRKPIVRYSPLKFCFAFVLTTTDKEPNSVREVVNLTEGRLYKDAMIEEMESLHKNEMWDLFELPSGRNLVSSKWVFKKKMNVAGQVEKFKARPVAKGYSQVEGVDIDEIFSLVAKLTSIRVLMSLAAKFDLEIEQMDVKTSFVHRDLEE
jgi:hypothetical protein